jgi:N-acetylglucosamine-6-phosphate deacetylase
MMFISGRKPGGPLIGVEVSGERIARIISVDGIPRGRFSGGKDFFLAPGFIDIQVNGFAGIDFNHAAFDGDDLLPVCKALLRTGVTRFCPTLITGSQERLSRSIRQILKARGKHAPWSGRWFSGFI